MKNAKHPVVVALVLAATIAGGWWVGPVPLFAQPDAAATPEDVDRIRLDALADLDYAVRRNAELDLRSDPTLTLDRLRPMLAEARTLEQQQRLMRVAEHVFLRSQAAATRAGQAGPGSIGIEHKIPPTDALPGVRGSGVLVLSTLPGFPGHEALVPGDILLGINGQRWPLHLTNDVFGRAMRRIPAGGTARFTVLRDGQETPVSLTLAHKIDLTRMYQTRNLQLSPRFANLWQTTRAELLALTPEPVAPDLTPPPPPAPPASPPAPASQPAQTQPASS
ncbi:MAG: PDZ domain-containing protein [Planctomycetota bacterium]